MTRPRLGALLLIAALPTPAAASEPSDFAHRVTVQPIERTTDADLLAAAATPAPSPATPSTKAGDRPDYGRNLIVGGVVLGITAIGVGTALIVTSGGDPTSNCAPATSTYSSCLAQHDSQETSAIVAGALLTSLGSLAMTLMIMVGGMQAAQPDPAPAIAHLDTPSPAPRLSFAPAFVPGGGGAVLSGHF